MQSSYGVVSLSGWCGAEDLVTSRSFVKICGDFAFQDIRKGKITKGEKSPITSDQKI